MGCENPSTYCMLWLIQYLLLPRRPFPRRVVRSDRNAVNDEVFEIDDGRFRGGIHGVAPLVLDRDGRVVNGYWNILYYSLKSFVSFEVHHKAHILYFIFIFLYVSKQNMMSLCDIEWPYILADPLRSRTRTHHQKATWQSLSLRDEERWGRKAREEIWCDDIISQKRPLQSNDKKCCFLLLATPMRVLLVL